MKHHYVYVIKNLINNKKYIGKRSCSCDIKEDDYMGSGIVLELAYKKYGIENFSKKIVKTFNSEKEAFEYEKKLIREKNACISEEYYNIAEGGLGGNTILGMSNEKYQTYCLKFSKENNPMYGRKHTYESRRKMSINSKNKKHTMETRNKMANLRKNENNPKARKVRCITTNEIFNCAKYAIEKYNINKTGISDCCHGRQKTAGKHPITGERLKWEFVDNE